MDGKQFYLLGLMHGHFDIKNLNADVVTDDDAKALGAINSGIGVVIPVEKIIETVNHPELVAMRKEIVAKMAKDEGAKPDLADAEAAKVRVRAEHNPDHKEDFTRLLNAAAKRRGPKD